MKDQIEASLKLLKFVADSQLTLTQINGQRRLGPPPGWTGPPPGPKCEIFVGSIPRNYYEPEIVLIFGTVGKIYELRLMMEFSGANRGYCFIMYTTEDEAARAIRELDQYEIYPGKRIGVVASANNRRLYINQLPRAIDSAIIIKEFRVLLEEHYFFEELIFKLFFSVINCRVLLEENFEELIFKIYEITDDVDKVAVYRYLDGLVCYVLVSYKTHRGAAMARRRLVPETNTLFEGSEINVEWAHPHITPSNVVRQALTIFKNFL
ncbi:putative RNA-binding protein 46 [Xylocopa sonorina]|uniref:putative RNA-binding protein 46 n=1 Tax=Xylocopa sonorina TaxID=1818115 RepID=UPI00403AC92A